jgi:transcriptional regulator with XRE-family HTH domain
MMSSNSVNEGTMSFARQLHDLRMRNRLSLQDVANAVGISKAHVWNLEKGLSEKPSIDLVVKLADLFRVRVADLVGENPAADTEAPEMVAMFRDLKQLGEADRQTIRVLMEELKRRRNDQA